MPEMETAEMLSGADLYQLMLEAGVYSGESNKMRWEELGHSKKFEEKHRAKDLKDPAQVLSFVKAYGSWLSTFERPKKGQGSEERVSLADMLEDYTHCERVVRVFIANLPEGNDGLIKAVEGHYANLVVHNQRVDAGTALQQVFQKIMLDLSDTHFKYYRNTFETCKRIKQGPGEKLKSYISRIRTQAQKTLTCPLPSFRFIMEERRETIESNFNETFSRLFEARISNTMSMPKHMFCKNVACPQVCTGPCKFRWYLDLEQDILNIQAVVPGTPRPREETSRQKEEVQAKPAKQQGWPKNMAKMIRVNAVGFRELLKKEDLDLETNTVERVQAAIMGRYGDGKSNPGGPKGGVPENTEELELLALAIKPHVGMCFTCLSLDHKNADCPVRKQNAPGNGWLKFAKARRDAFNDAKERQN